MKVLLNHCKFKKNPTAIDEIIRNQSLRASSLLEIKTKETISVEDAKATQEFWSAQVCFFVKQLHSKRDELAKIFPEIITAKTLLSKKNLQIILERIITALQKNILSEEEKRALIAVFVPTKSPVIEKKQREKTLKDDDVKSYADLKKTAPHIFIHAANSIEFAYQQALLNKRILVMDAANSQRPGAGPYAKGTYQEALTRHTNLYWTILADFNNVLQDLVVQKKIIPGLTDIDKEIKKINVLSYQLRFLQSILFFVNKAIVDDRYFATADFRKDFFTYADSIYSDMQNKVFEIPCDAGFIKEASIAELKGIEKTADLFIDDVFGVAVLDSKIAPLLIGEVAAPDKRMLEGDYDRACTFNIDLRNSDQEAMAEKMISDAILYILEQATQREVDTIILNAFGCGAFLNQAQTVATIFAKALTKYQKELSGKSIYFMDLSPGKCMEFGAVFAEKLKNQFNINCYPQGNNVSLTVLIDEIKVEAIVQTEAIIAAQNSSVLKQGYSLFKKKEPHHVIEIKDLTSQAKTKDTLKKAYLAGITTAIKAGKTTLHVPLLGTGKLKFTVADSIVALHESLRDIAATKTDVTQLKVNLHIPAKEMTHYLAVMNYLQTTPASSLSKTLSR